MAFDKPVRVARFGGTSAAEAANSAEPSSGKKDLGWVLDEEPPSSFFNWLHYRAYKWFRWLDERLSDSGSAANFLVSAPPVASSSDDGGDLRLQGSYSGTDADKDGGVVYAVGGAARGAGSSAVRLSAATRGAAGTAFRSAEEYLRADGSGIAGPTTFGTVVVSKATTIHTPAGSDANALEVIASASGSGYAAQLSANFTSSPQKSALSIGPQNKDPSVPANGDVYVNSASDQIAHYSAAAEPARFQNLDTLVKASLADATQLANTTGAVFDEDYTIPANTLRTGSVVRVRAWGKWANATVAAVLYMYLHIDGVSCAGSLMLDSMSGGTYVYWRYEADIIMRENDSSSDYSYTSRLSTELDDDIGGGASTGIDATIANLVQIQAGTGPADAGNTIDCYGLTVEVI